MSSAVMTFLKSLVGLAMLVCSAQEMDTSLFSALRWRNIGPFRAGRVTAVAGIPGDPNTFYFGTPGGGGMPTAIHRSIASRSAFMPHR